MREIKLMPLIVELIGSFFASSRDALERARNAKSSQAAKHPANQSDDNPELIFGTRGRRQRIDPMDHRPLWFTYLKCHRQLLPTVARIGHYTGVQRTSKGF